MARFAIFCVTLGLLVLGAIVALSGVFWFSDSGDGQGHFGGLFFLLVFGIPALGFCALMVIVGIVTGGFAAAKHPGAAGPPNPLPAAQKTN